MEVCVINREKEMDSLQIVLKENAELAKANVDYECLQQYNEHNPKFSIDIIVDKREGEEDERFIGYTCLYCCGKHRIKIEFDIITGFWKINPEQFYPEDEQQMLNRLFDDLYHVRCLTLNQQIQLIIHRLDQYFFEKAPIRIAERDENKMSISSSIFPEQNCIKTLNNQLIELSLYQGSKGLPIPEDDEQQKCSNVLSKEVVDYGLQSLLSGSRPKFYGLGPPPVAPRRSRQNSACSTQSSVRYASFLPPPPTAPIRRRRVIHSIVLHVQRKKKAFEKFLDAFKQTESIAMDQLGLEFLRLYDGKFNYREGHTFVMSFRKKTWFLTIDKIKCVECQAGEKEPRSVLLLDYKHHVTPVHV